MNGIIYGIKDLSSDDIIYIGSTTDLHRRKAAHKCDCFTKQKDRLIYNYIREKTDREHFDECFAYEILYSDEFENKQELRVKEEEFIKEKIPRCNHNKAFQTHEELNEYHRERYHNSDKRREYMREYENTDKRREYTREYNKKMREHKREYLREWRRRKKLAQE